MNNHKIGLALILIFYLLPIIAITQEDIEVSNSDSIYSFVDQPPEFLDSTIGIRKYFMLTLNYPKEAIDDSIEGKVYVGVVVEKDGSISNVKIRRGIGGGCDEEAMRVVSEMPSWNPGKYKGKIVRTSTTIPVVFSLDNPTGRSTKRLLKVDTLPSFVGGTDSLYSYLLGSLNHSNTFLFSLVVNVSFVVETDGSLSNIYVPDNNEQAYAEKAIRKVQNMPKWNPGKIGNTKVRVPMLVPVKVNIFIPEEDLPVFPGGINQLYVYLQNNVKYPHVAKKKGIQGRVFINFIVETDGSITHVRVLRGIGGGCNEEAISVIEKMPRWKPGKYKGKPARVSFTLPIKFTLTNH